MQGECVFCMERTEIDKKEVQNKCLEKYCQSERNMIE